MGILAVVVNEYSGSLVRSKQFKISLLADATVYVRICSMGQCKVPVVRSILIGRSQRFEYSILVRSGGKEYLFGPVQIKISDNMLPYNMLSDNMLFDIMPSDNML
jgi:hypothetical protein